MDLRQYLIPSFYIDSDHPMVMDFANRHTKEWVNPIEKAIALYYVVRDEFVYNPYLLDIRSKTLKASYLLTKDNGYCGEKACLLAAAGRAVGVPARLGFAIVRNHIGTEKLEAFLKTDQLVFHGYTEFYLGDKWVKCTPAFNKELCARLGVEPLEFDGKTDSVFQAYDRSGGDFMEYIHDYGQFIDYPKELFISELEKHYPHLMTEEWIVEDGYIIDMRQIAERIPEH